MPIACRKKRRAECEIVDFPLDPNLASVPPHLLRIERQADDNPV
jgi:hypothetical protein